MIDNTDLHIKANEEADYRRDILGFNVIPADCANKRPLKGFKWSEYQDKTIPQELHDQWKSEGAFDIGMAMIMGRLWFGERAGRYGLVVDIDNWEAAKAWFCPGCDTDDSLWQRMKIENADHNRIEWHQNKAKYHIFYYADEQLDNDSSSIPGIELRAKNELVYAGKHKDGNYWTPLGTDKISDGINLRVFKEKFKTSGRAIGISTVSERNNPNYYKHEGENRSLDLLQQMDSMIVHMRDFLSMDEIRQKAYEWHHKYQDPYSDDKFEANWKQALEYTSKIINGYKEEAEESRRKFRENEESARLRLQRNKNTTQSWTLRLAEKYEKLRSAVQSNLPGLWSPLRFALSVKSILNIRDCTLPFSGIILGPPSSLKTVAVELFRDWDSRYVLYLDKFSPRSLVSHSANVKKEELGKIDLLPEIKNRILLTPELGPMFHQREEDLVDSLAILTRVLDGHGYESHTGVHGKRGYSGVYMFTQLGAAVEIPYRVRKQFSQLGPRFYFLRLPKASKDEDYYYNSITSSEFKDKVEPIKTAFLDYLAEFNLNPLIVEKDDLPKVPVNREKDSEKAIRYIVKLGMLLAPLRAFVPTWETKDSQGSQYSYEIAIVEDPSRAIQLLKNLALGHALCQGRNFITEEDIPLLIQVVLSTTSLERAELFSHLIDRKGKLTTREICDLLNTTRPTALRTMTELYATGLVSMTTEGEHDTAPKEIELESRFDWFLKDEFKHLWHKWNEDYKENCTLCVDKNKINHLWKETLQYPQEQHEHRRDFLYSPPEHELHSKAHFSGQWWYCKTCKYRDDGPGMIDHVCRNQNKESTS